MPDKPLWCGHLEEAVVSLRALPYPWVDRQTVERVLGVRRRRAQQILQPCVRQQIGSNGVADREELIAHLRRLSAGEVANYERRRRERLAKVLESVHQSWTRHPKALVEAPTTVVNQKLEHLPQGVVLEQGKLTVHFTTAVEALEKLLAVAIAAGNDIEGFSRIVETG